MKLFKCKNGALINIDEIVSIIPNDGTGAIFNDPRSGITDEDIIDCWQVCFKSPMRGGLLPQKHGSWATTSCNPLQHSITQTL